MNSRRQFLQSATSLALGASLPATAADTRGKSSFVADGEYTKVVSLNGLWQFRLDPNKVGQTNGWYRPNQSGDSWQNVIVPHTWQVAQESAEYFGTAWYRRLVKVPEDWKDQSVRIEFEGVFHSASVWINGSEVGEHLRKGYTAFDFDITRLLHLGADNVLVVMVNSDFDSRMLPRGHSSDWAHDGGIYRPVALLITPRVYIERVDVDAVPDLANGFANLDISVVIHNSADREFKGKLSVHAVEEETGLTVLEDGHVTTVNIAPGATITRALPVFKIEKPKLWHFDTPTLYCLTVGLNSASIAHEFTTTFGIRSIEVKDGSFWLNAERVRLMGVERMAGSNPIYGMAEPDSWIDHDHDDLKNLNCVFTRVHWPQDKRVLDYCDRHGIFIQTEVPTWGPDTFKDMKNEPDPEIMQNGFEQLQEMIARDRNHPCIFSWGLCNEINGQNPPAYNFAMRMYEEAKRLDPRRLRSYASNSLQQTPKNDVARLMDFIECNEYYESWSPGTTDDLRRTLEEIHHTFPDKPIVISEYGWCACTPDRPEGDNRRTQVLREHTHVFRNTQYVGGVIFFCYNDYRTHIGDKGTGVMKQRVHGVVDLFGSRKASYSVLREESSPVESLACSGNPNLFTVTLRTRDSVPAYTVNGYKLRGTLYGSANIPLECRETSLSTLKPGESISNTLQFKEKEEATRVEFDVVRPTGFSAVTTAWIP